MNTGPMTSEQEALKPFAVCRRHDFDDLFDPAQGCPKCNAERAALAGSAQPAYDVQQAYRDMKNAIDANQVGAVSPAPDAPVSGLESVPRDEALRLADEIVASIHGHETWRVMNTDESAYCIEFSAPECLNPEMACVRWLAGQNQEYIKRNGYHAVRSLEYFPAERFALEAAAAIKSLAAAPTAAQPAPEQPQCGKTCACLTQCGDFYDNAGLPQPAPVEPQPDDVLEALDLDPESFRSEGGWINKGKLRAAILHPYNYLPEDHWLQARFSKPGGRPAARAQAPQAQPSSMHRTTGWVAPRDRYVPPVLFNPYTGEPRDVRDVQSDPQGILIQPPGSAILSAAPAAPQAQYHLSGDEQAGLKRALMRSVKGEAPEAQPLTDERMNEARALVEELDAFVALDGGDLEVVARAAGFIRSCIGTDKPTGGA